MYAGRESLLYHSPAGGESISMVRKTIWSMLFAVLALGIAVLTLDGQFVAAEQKDDKLPDIKEIMKLAHGKTDGYMLKIGKAAKAAKWDDAQKTAADMSITADALAKNKPSKGKADSWEKQTTKYSETVKSVVDATEKKDAKATADSLKAVGATCNACHSAHK